MMKIEETGIEGLLVYTPTQYRDDRGYFQESVNVKALADKLGYTPVFVQDNESFSTYGVIRALHSQSGEHAQAKLVRVIEGEVLDVVVDIRKGSVTYGKTFSVVLSAQNNKHMFVPRGFLHGFSVLSPQARFLYKCDNFFQPSAEVAVAYNDPELNIDWQLPKGVAVLSEKDRQNPLFKDVQCYGGQ